MQAITLDTTGCDSVTEQIDIGTNLLYDVLELWSGSQPKPINPGLECWVAFLQKVRTLNRFYTAGKSEIALPRAQYQKFCHRLRRIINSVVV